MLKKRESKASERSKEIQYCAHGDGCFTGSYKGTMTGYSESAVIPF